MLSTAPSSRIARIDLIEPAATAGITALSREKDEALRDLIARGHFQPLNDNHGPYDVTLGIEDNHIVLRLRNAKAQDLQMHILSLRPYRRLIQDYFMIIASYEQARHTLTPEKLEAIDMGRRGLHNDGAEMIRQRLKEKIDMDLETARRLFTLLCVLHKNDLKLMA